MEPAWYVTTRGRRPQARAAASAMNGTGAWTLTRSMRFADITRRNCHGQNAFTGVFDTLNQAGNRTTVSPSITSTTVRRRRWFDVKTMTS